MASGYGYTHSIVYIVMGLVGVLGNSLMVAVFMSERACHNCTYLLMGSIAVADAIMSAVVGCYTGLVVIIGDLPGQHINQMIAFLEITGWFVGILTYAALGVNRAVAICATHPKLSLFNQLSFGIIVIVSSWLFSCSIGQSSVFLYTIAPWRSERFVYKFTYL